jgi:hypothetical protein
MSASIEAIHSQMDMHHRDKPGNKGKSLFATLSVFVLVGCGFLYFVNWFSEAQKNKSTEGVEAAAIIVLKKLPLAAGSELASILSDKDVEYRRASQFGNKGVMGDVQPAVVSFERPIVVKKSLPPNDDEAKRPETPRADSQKDSIRYTELPVVENKNLSPASEEPDPASPIDYVLQKRRLPL